MTPANDASILDWALWYADHGWPVLPLDGKVPVTVHGVLNASTDPVLIAEKWRREPHLNVGLRTGIAFDALDIDSTEALQVFAQKEKHAGPRSRTGKKGYHLLYLPNGHANATFMQDLRLDWRGINGYIVAPPSVHPETGDRYVWQRSPEETLAEAPPWLFEGIRLPSTHDEDRKRVPHYRNQTARYLANTVDPLDVLREANIPFKRSGKGYKTRCLWPDERHDDHTPSLHIYPDNKSFYCFGCGRYGGSPDLIAVLGLGSSTLVKAIAYENQLYGRKP